MAVEAAEVTQIGVIPDNDHGDSCWLRCSQSEMAYPFDHIQHTLADKGIAHQVLYLVSAEVDLPEYYVNEGTDSPVHY